MVDYRIVKYCRTCKERFVVDKSEAKKIYCSNCQKRMDDNNLIGGVK